MSRRYIYTRFLFVLSLLFTGIFSVYAAPSTNDATKFPVTGQNSSGQITWPGGSVTKNTTVVLPCFSHVNSNGVTVRDVSIQLASTITVKKGYKLTIKMDPDASWTQRAIIVIANGFSSTQGMFLVEEGASLVIEGLDSDKKWLGIKGSRNTGSISTIYNSTSKTWTKPTGYEQYYNTFANGYGMVTAVGNVTMKNVRMYDSYCEGDGAALVVKRNTNTDKLLAYGKVSLTGCRITNCVATFGAALVIYNQVKKAVSGDIETVDPIVHDDYDPEGSSVTLTDCEIKNCYNTLSDNVCGTIRTGGGAYSNLYLNNTTISGNYAEGTCAGVVWNAHGLSNKQTVLRFDGCVVENNYSKSSGAGLYMSSSFEFCNNTSYIRGNKSGKDGGGIHIRAYTGIKGMEGYPQTLDMSLGEFVVVRDNKAVNGAGIYIEDQASNDLGANSVMNVAIDGATIADNTATGNGGGIYFHGNNKTIDFNFYLNSGTLTGNKAVHGGGFYGDRGTNLNPDRVSLNFNGGQISSCEASGNGGGIYVSGLHIGCAENPEKGMVLSDNKTTQNTDGVGYGGGMFITSDAVFNMNSGEVSSNYSAKEGGGLYITDNAVVNIKGGDFYNNKSYTNGGGIFLQSGTLTMSKIGDRKSKIRKNENGQNGLTSANGGGVYVKNGTFTIEDGEITGNVAKGYGGGIYMGNAENEASQIIIKGGAIGENSARYGAGIFVLHGDCEMTGGSIDGNIASTGGGGVYVSSSLNVKGNTSITNNQANGASDNTNSGGGGVLVADGGIFHMSENSIISGNTSVSSGGGLRARSGASEIVVDNGVISSNESSVSGGGLALFGGSLTLNGGTIEGNVCEQNGGGLYFESAGKLLSINGGDITHNTATGYGGGIFASAGDLTIGGGTISNNTATTNNGGGINFTSPGGVLTITEGLVIENTSGKHGGGIYAASCNLSFSKGIIQKNHSTQSGGGIYFSGTNFTLAGGQILDNTADFYGGGLCFVDPADGTPSLKAVVSKGDVIGNVAARCGGAIFMQFEGTLDFSGGNIVGNKAVDGGGVCLQGSLDTQKGPVMTFGNGIIRNNLAKYDSSYSDVNFTTGNQYTIGRLNGVGGAVYLENYASMKFDLSDGLGIYANLADKMADDIFANGNGTSVALPNVSSMDLSGYNSKTSELFWVEDYMTNDTGYASGTAIAGASHKAVRYRDAIASQSTVYKVPAGTYSGKYLALSIGYEVIYVTLQRTGLQAGESAIYRIFRIDDGVPSVYSEVLLTGSAGAPVQSKRVALYSGKWRVEETPWTWTYVPPAAIERDITGSTDAQDKVFSFGAAKKDSMPLHAEDIVVNDFGEGAAVTGSYINSGSINDLQNTTDYQLK